MQLTLWLHPCQVTSGSNHRCANCGNHVGSDIPVSSDNHVGSGGDDQFTPVELLLTAIAGCSAIDVDILTSRRSEPTTFDVTASGEKLRDEQHNHMGPITVRFEVSFPEGAEGDAARSVYPDSVERSHDRLCTVSRTVQLGADVTMQIAGESGD